MELSELTYFRTYNERPLKLCRSPRPCKALTQYIHTLVLRPHEIVSSMGWKLEVNNGIFCGVLIQLEATYALQVLQVRLGRLRILLQDRQYSFTGLSALSHVTIERFQFILL
jgi:hypothetical protein